MTNIKLSPKGIPLPSTDKLETFPLNLEPIKSHLSESYEAPATNPDREGTPPAKALLDSDQIEADVATLAWEYVRRVEMGEESPIECFLKRLSSDTDRRRFKRTINTHLLIRMALEPEAFRDSVS